jgi:hypothetical protein
MGCCVGKIRYYLRTKTKLIDILRSLHWAEGVISSLADRAIINLSVPCPQYDGDANIKEDYIERTPSCTQAQQEEQFDDQMKEIVARMSGSTTADCDCNVATNEIGWL